MFTNVNRQRQLWFLYLPQYLHFPTPLTFSELKQSFFPIVLAASFYYKNQAQEILLK